jgi:pilus assembly protein CpaB
MRGKTLGAILFGVSLIAVIFAVMNSSRRGDASLPPQQVLAATVELSAGTLLREQDITWQPILNPQPDQFARPSEVQIKAKPDIVEETVAGLYGAVLRHSLATGTPIRRGDIVKPGDRDFLQVVLPPGMRAIAVPVSTGGASTGLLTPGDHVDVVLTQNFTHEGRIFACWRSMRRIRNRVPATMLPMGILVAPSPCK